MQFSKKLIIGVLVPLIVFIIVLGVINMTKKPPETPKDLDDPIQQEEVKTPVFDRLIRLRDADAGFILNKEEPTFIFIGHFETNESDKASKEIYEKCNEEFGFSNLAYVIDLDDTTLQVEDDTVIFGTETFKAKGQVITIFEGEAVASFDMKDQTLESAKAFFNQFYVTDSEENKE